MKKDLHAILILLAVAIVAATVANADVRKGSDNSYQDRQSALQKDTISLFYDQGDFEEVVKNKKWKTVTELFDIGRYCLPSSFENGNKGGETLNSGPGYCFLTDSEMDEISKSVTGTRFRPTAFPDYNTITLQGGFDGAYCSGFECNGSIDITPKMPTRAIGFTVLNAWGGPGAHEGRWYATITFKNGSQSDFLLPLIVLPPSHEEPGFFGIISEEEIVSVHLGDMNDSPWFTGYLEIDTVRIAVSPGGVIQGN